MRTCSTGRQDRLATHDRGHGRARQTVEHPLATLKAWMGATPTFLTRGPRQVRTEMSLHGLAYNLSE